MKFNSMKENGGVAYLMAVESIKNPMVRYWFMKVITISVVLRMDWNMV